MKKVLVIGATGDQGHPLLRRLVTEGFAPVAALRNPDALSGTEFSTIETVAADLHETETFVKAASGVSAIAVNLPFTYDLDEARQFGAAISAAARAGGVNGNGAERVVFNTSCYVHDSDLGLGGHDGRRIIEQAIFDCGVPYAIFEPVVFMDNMIRSWCKPSIVNNDIFAYPAGPTLDISWICLEDIAAFMVEGIKRSHVKSGRFAIGGPETLRGDDVAERLSRGAGRPIKFKSLSPDEFAAEMSLLVTGSREYAPGSLYERISWFYKWYNDQKVSPLTVNMESVLAQFPIELTPLHEWAAKQDWTDPSDPALGVRMAGKKT